MNLKRMIPSFTVLCGALLVSFNALAQSDSDSASPFLESELIFPVEPWHNHASCIVEAPDGTLVVCWYRGSGERQADDVKILGSRKRPGDTEWETPFTLADTPGFPDANCAMIIDPQERLWLFYPVILANQWESAITRYHVASDYLANGAPKWDRSELLLFKPGTVFEEQTLAFVDRLEERLANSDYSQPRRERAREHFATLRKYAGDKLSRRLGWMPRAHPFIVDNRRLIVPLYSDGFSFSIMAYTDDWGQTWQSSEPFPGLGNIQPSIGRRNDGSLYTLMRDNGPPPKRLHQSSSQNQGETWSPVTDSDRPNPGSGAEIISLANGHWVLISNDTENGRHQLAVEISDDEGETWRWKRYLEQDQPGDDAGSYSYPSIIQAKDGTLHATYSYHLSGRKESIKYAHFNEAWIKGE
jgi:predicted neuraminidase